MPTYSPDSRHYSPASQDIQLYITEALSTARSMAATLDYMLELHGEQPSPTRGGSAFRTVFTGLQQQAHQVVGLLEDCRS